jgi:hypothetical protein
VGSVQSRVQRVGSQMLHGSVVRPHVNLRLAPNIALRGNGMHKLAQRGMHRVNQLLTAETYSKKIRPLLSTISTSMIASGIGVSRWYAGRIRQGHRPHPRHWQALADLAFQIRSPD